MKKAAATMKMRTSGSNEGKGRPSSQLIDARIKELNDWLLQSKQPLPHWLLLTKAKVQHVKT